jgi:hypothetical protein
LATTAVDWLWFWVFDVGCCKETDFYLFTYCELFWLFTVYCWSVGFSANRIGSFRLCATYYIVTGFCSKFEFSELFSSFDGLLREFWEVSTFSWSLSDLLKMHCLYFINWNLSKNLNETKKINPDKHYRLLFRKDEVKKFNECRIISGKPFFAFWSIFEAPSSLLGCWTQAKFSSFWTLSYISGFVFGYWQTFHLFLLALLGRW